eukprot:COSAG06_NODE_822_length_12092_cov_48.322105_1_plen_50_part_10
MCPKLVLANSLVFPAQDNDPKGGGGGGGAVTNRARNQGKDATSGTMPSPP